MDNLHIVVNFCIIIIFIIIIRGVNWLHFIIIIIIILQCLHLFILHASETAYGFWQCMSV